MKIIRVSFESGGGQLRIKKIAGVGDKEIVDAHGMKSHTQTHLSVYIHS